MSESTKRNVTVDDALWDRLRSLAFQHRRTLAGEVRVALEVYANLADGDEDDVIEEALNASAR